MHSAMKLYQPMERAASYHTHIALLPACDHALAAPWSLLVPAVLIVGVMGVFLRAALAGPLRAPPLPLTWGLMIGATILVSPHLQFYDAGLLVLPAALGLDHLLRNRQRPSTTVRVGLAAGYVLFPVYSAVHWLGFQPLVLWPLLMFFWLAGLCRSAATLRRQNADRSGPGDAAEPDPAPFTGRRPDRSWPGRPWP
jgi:hypothetical protein